MDGAASVITVVGLALQSTQVIYKTVSGIRNAPRTLQHLTSNLRDLSNVLQQLNGFGDDLCLSNELPRLIRNCAKYIGEFEAKVSKLCPPKDKKVARLWKNVKATLQENELDRMSVLLHQHYMALSLQINIIKGKRLERIENSSNRQITLSTTHTPTLENTKTGVDQMSSIIGDLQTTSQASTQSLSHAIHAVGDKVLNVANMSTEQSATLNTRMESIFELLKRLEQSEKTQQREAKTALREAFLSPDDQETGQQIPGPSNNCLEEALNRLAKLVEEKEQTLSSTEAESIIEDVDKILLHLLKAEEHSEHNDIRKGKKKAYDEGDDSDVQDVHHEREIKRVKGILNASDRIVLKKKVGQYQRTADKRLSFKTTYRVRSSSNGMFTIKTRRGIPAKPTPQNIIKDTLSDETSESFDVSVVYIPNNHPKAYLAFIFSQRSFLEGCFLRTPALSVSALIPDDSEVFQVIENGEVDRLIKMLDLREASLTDRDTKGRCLLNYALRFAKPNICKFLIHEGADVDFIEEAIIHALNVCDDEIFGEDKDSLALLDECRHQLLEAGADPTISTPNYNSPATIIFNESRKVIKDSPQSNQYADSDKEALATLLNHGFEFLASEVDPCEVVACFIERGGWTLDGVYFLLQLGGSRLPVQNLTCTLLFAIHGSWGVDETEFLRVLILLIESGADVTNYGHWVSEAACNPWTKYRTKDGSLHGMYDAFDSKILNHDLRLRRIWAEALAACGYDAEEFISQSTRFQDLSQTNDDGLEYQSGTTDEDDISNVEDQAKLPEPNEEAFSGEQMSATADAYQPSDITFYNSSDWAHLEEEAFVWRN